jgi:ABC-type transporter MlaC component
MSTVIILAPVIIGSWPIITAAVTAAAAGLGMTVNEALKEACQENQVDTNQAVVVELENSEVLASQVASGKELVLTKDGITIKVTRDGRGRCKVCAEGTGYSKAELKRLAQEFTQKLTQCFVYHRTVSELKNKNFQMVNEEVAEDGTIRVHVRRWVD